MKEELIKFKTAKLAKEKGFDEETLYYYRGENSLGKNSITYRKNSQMNVWDDLQEKWSAPTQSLLQKWLREVHNMDVLVIKDNIKEYNYFVWGETRVAFDISDTYEEALEKGLQESLKLIK